MLDSVLPLSNETSCNSDILVWGIKMSVLRAPLHMVHLHWPLVTGHVKVAVRPRIPISGVSFILGNDLAGGKMFPSPEVVDIPVSAAPAPPASSVPNVFPVCAITRAQARKLGDAVDLSESFMATLDESELSRSVSPTTESEKVSKCLKCHLCPSHHTAASGQRLHRDKDRQPKHIQYIKGLHKWHILC